MFKIFKACWNWLKSPYKSYLDKFEILGEFHDTKEYFLHLYMHNVKNYHTLQVEINAIKTTNDTLSRQLNLITESLKSLPTGVFDSDLIDPNVKPFVFEAAPIKKAKRKRK